MVCRGDYGEGHNQEGTLDYRGALCILCMVPPTKEIAVHEKTFIMWELTSKLVKQINAVDTTLMEIRQLAEEPEFSAKTYETVRSIQKLLQSDLDWMFTQIMSIHWSKYDGHSQ